MMPSGGFVKVVSLYFKFIHFSPVGGLNGFQEGTTVTFSAVVGSGHKNCPCLVCGYKLKLSKDMCN